MNADDMNLPDPSTPASEPDDGVSPWWRGPGMWKIWLPMVLTVICMVWLYVKIGVALFT
ncbi:hypothetical protein [Mycobacteroides salmoniphilum]|uniref:hypothetical protein n=1 Tax=Mycobacteroides salmoniphilum TaxID=404941 RepID=UPI0012FF7065|nr:hypothetical protein [Mycobacteroides salmoniphilum]